MDGQRITRRAAAGTLLGLVGVAGWAALSQAAGRWGRLAAAQARTSQLPPWVSNSPRSQDAYEGAYANLELMATLPCYCGCGALPNPHSSLRECFRQPNGQIEQHASGCETGQDEAIAAVGWANDGLTWSEIHTRIIATYSGRGPGSPGHLV
jgi:hypothetical protein